jgi:predicted O-linked N-acetylglucosamine transferase (SPINDLY family)
MALDVGAALSRALALHRGGRLGEAQAIYRDVLRVAPKHPDALYLLGVSEAQSGRFPEAERLIRESLTINPNSPIAHSDLGNVLSGLGHYEDALASFDRAIALKPDHADAYLNRGNAFVRLGRYADALASYDRAIAIRPAFADAFGNRAGALLKLDRDEEALVSAAQALALRPNLAAPWLVRANVLHKRKQYEEAIAAYDRSLALNREGEWAEGLRLHCKLLVCDWSNLEAECARLLAAVRAGKRVADPFCLVSLPSATPADLLHCARDYVAERPAFPALWRGEVHAHDRIRVAYVSSDLRDHPVGYLTAGLFERHDRTRFEVVAIALRADEQSETYRRIKGAVEHHVDAHGMSDREIARLLRAREIDIAVDLNGFTEGGRLNVFLNRPAPVQVGWLGFPGSMGSRAFDYILADRTLIPQEEFGSYDERVVWLPDGYQPNDDRRRIADATPSRRDCGLPDGGIVFCSFNNTYKIAPAMFDIWMRLLCAVEGSVLWLREENAAAVRNLRREAERRGVAPERLVFAPRTPRLEDHLARQRLADLFLDTLPYNAHTTASDALWAGLPLVTCRGERFAGRVAASLLRAAGVPELIAESLADYEALALRLAREPAALAAVKDKLARNRASCPLFDTARFTRHLEAAYAEMWERHRRDQKPAGFAVGAIA